MKDLRFIVKDKIDYDEKNLILIIYDIIDNRRRTKLFKYLSGYANPVQKSCFESYLSMTEFGKMKSRIHQFINPEEDNLRIYKLSAYGEVYNFGRDNENSVEKILII